MDPTHEYFQPYPACDHGSWTVYEKHGRLFEQCGHCGFRRQITHHRFAMLLDRKADEIIDTSDLPYNKTRRAFAENEVAKRAAEKKASMDAESEKYKRYLVTEKWLSMKNKVMKRDAYLCQCCLSAEATICHHKTYERKYNEAAFDLVAVCFYCHEKIHGNA